MQKGYSKKKGEANFRIVYYQKTKPKNIFLRPKNSLQDEEDSPPPKPWMDITKLPNGQFKDYRYNNTDDSFFVQMGGRGTQSLIERLKLKSQERSSSLKTKSNFTNHLIKLAVQNRIGTSQSSSYHSSMKSIKIKPFNIIDMTPITIKEPPKTPQYFSARQKLYKVLTNKQ